MKVKAKRTEGGFLFPLIKGLENIDEIEVTIEIEAANEETITDEYIEKNWKTLLLNATRKPYKDDYELLIDAYTEYKYEKSTFRH